jgi:hypothetical protein
LQFTLSVPVNFTSCGTSATINYTGYVTAGTQTFSTNAFNVSDGCGHTYGMSASGSLAGGVISITFVVAATGGTSTCIFTGTK